MLQLIGICSLFAYGMFTLQRPGFAFDFLPRLWKRLPQALHEPLFACGVCVVSIWGGLCYVYITLVKLWVEGLIGLSAFLLPVALICMAGLNAIFDRSVKAFEKHYGYRPAANISGEKRWDYLLPYAEIRRLLTDKFIVDNLNRGHYIVEIGGCNPKYKGLEHYIYYDHSHPFDAYHFQRLMKRFHLEGAVYSVFILGLYYEGPLRDLKKLIQNSHHTLIEYSDDGLSRSQVAMLTEGIKTKLLIPEYSMGTEQAAPAVCGSVGKRKVLILQPK